MNILLDGAQRVLPRRAIPAGRAAFKIARLPRKRFASASSPVDGLSA